MTLDHQSQTASADASRYEVQRKLGEGGAGTVYLVRDRDTGERLALKRLHRVDERSGTRLKQEFRSLSNINHRNVIKLYDLGQADGEWFLTMEYLEGQELLEHLEANIRSSVALGTEHGGSDAEVEQIGRVAAAFHQLASGVRALHRAGVLHRDLKPSNVIVAAGRVVVLDFGLAREVGEDATTITMEGNTTGTPAYMAPEQVLGRDVGEPNDWYAFGVMLYEALSGFLPIEGRLHELLRRKLELDPTPLDRLVAGIPAPLSELCKRLLDRQPSARPSADEVLAVLRGYVPARPPEPASDVPSNSRRLRTSEPWTFGRDGERESLRKHLTTVTSGGFAVARVSGPSGIGKSRLVDRFLRDLEQGELAGVDVAPMILRSRCYERESVPFKALDAAVDAIVSQLSREHEVVVSHSLPRNVRALAQLFPALCRLSVMQRLLDREPPRGTTRQARDEAETALRDLITRLAARRPVVLWIDDLHWGDLDSALILKSWIEPPGIAGLMLIFSYRSDELSTSPCLRLLFGDGDALAESDQVAVGPLEDEHIRALCQERLASVDRPKELLIEIAEHIVLEAQGSPYLASQLTELALSQLGGQPGALAELNLERLVARRTAMLSDPARRLLHVLAAAGRPVPARLALSVANAAHASRAAVHELSALGLTRTREAEGVRLIEVYHNRFREAVLGSLTSSARAELDRGLLRALEGEDTSDVAWLHTLALGAGEPTAALRYGSAAGDVASAALAFERAAALYTACLQLPASADERTVLLRKLAQAQAQAGHGLSAADAYLEAARGSAGLAAIKLERQAASHYLRSGHFEKGEALVQRVLTALDIEAPKSSNGLFAAIAWERARLAVRGLRFTPRDLASVPLERRYAGELCGTLSVETQIYDPLRAALFQARCLRMALDSGVTEGVARALCVAATMAASTGGEAGVVRADALLDRADSMASELKSTLVYGNIRSARTVCAFLGNRMEQTIEHSAEAERLFRELSASDEGEYYHRFMVLGARITALYQLGHFLQARTELDNALSEARSTQNTVALLSLSPLRTRFEIAADRAQAAVARLEAECELLPQSGFGLLHAWHLSSLMRVGCATGDHAWAFHRMRDDLQRFRASVLKRGTVARVVSALHARFVLNECVARGASVAEATRLVSDDLRVLASDKSPLAHAVLLRTRARLSYLAGKRDAARDALRTSSTLLAAGALEESARDRYAYGLLLGGDEGLQHRAAALETLRGFGCVNPQRDIASYYPELFERAR